MLALELELFQQLRSEVAAHLQELQQVAAVLSELDVL